MILKAAEDDKRKRMGSMNGSFCSYQSDGDSPYHDGENYDAQDSEEMDFRSQASGVPNSGEFNFDEKYEILDHKILGEVTILYA